MGSRHATRVEMQSVVPAQRNMLLGLLVSNTSALNLIAIVNIGLRAQLQVLGVWV